MSLLDDARRVLMGNVSVHLVHDPEHGATYICLHCPARVLYSSGESFVHASECPVRSMPKILAALEAAEQLAKLDPTESDYSSRPGQCQFCDSTTIPAPWASQLLHATDCPWQALEVALSNDEKAEVLTT